MSESGQGSPVRRRRSPPRPTRGPQAPLVARRPGAHSTCGKRYPEPGRVASAAFRAHARTHARTRPALDLRPGLRDGPACRPAEDRLPRHRSQALGHRGRAVGRRMERGGFESSSFVRSQTAAAEFSPPRSPRLRECSRADSRDAKWLVGLWRANHRRERAGDSMSGLTEWQCALSCHYATRDGEGIEILSSYSFFRKLKI